MHTSFAPIAASLQTFFGAIARSPATTLRSKARQCRRLDSGNWLKKHRRQRKDGLCDEDFWKDAFWGVCRRSALSSKNSFSGIKQERGDNIYFTDAQGDWKQRPSYHTEKQIEKDLRARYVLASNHFFYFGANAALIPERFRTMMSSGRYYRHIVGPHVDEFVTWLQARYEPGIYGKPYAIASEAFCFFLTEQWERYYPVLKSKKSCWETLGANEPASGKHR